MDKTNNTKTLDIKIPDNNIGIEFDSMYANIRYDEAINPELLDDAIEHELEMYHVWG